MFFQKKWSFQLKLDYLTFPPSLLNLLLLQFFLPTQLGSGHNLKSYLYPSLIFALNT